MTQLMGVVNVAPDSFSGDGIYLDPERAAERAVELVAAGAAVIDVGGESTRPGATPISLAEELRRVVPAIEHIVRSVTAPASVDTSKSEVARPALAAGAAIVNDVSGLRDAALPAVAASAGATLVLVHNRPLARGVDLVNQVIDELRRLITAAEAAGVERVIVDPGLGFSKGWRENLVILRRLRELAVLGKPLMVGPSRKGMIGRVLGTEVDDRVEGTLALVSLAAARGADLIRVHDVAQMSRAVRMIDAIVRS
ncbi:MAG: dihydropteroate synthase [Chloroflexota bacterium]